MIYEHFLNGNERVFRIVVKLLESGNGGSFHLSRIRTVRFIQKETESGHFFDFIVEGNKVVRKWERKRGEYRLLPLRYF